MSYYERDGRLFCIFLLCSAELRAHSGAGRRIHLRSFRRSIRLRLLILGHNSVSRINHMGVFRQRRAQQYIQRFVIEEQASCRKTKVCRNIRAPSQQSATWVTVQPCTNSNGVVTSGPIAINNGVVHGVPVSTANNHVLAESTFKSKSHPNCRGL